MKNADGVNTVRTALFSVISNSAFTNEINLDLSGVIHFGLNLLGNLSCNEYHFFIVDDFRNNHDSDFTSCLNSKAFFDTIIRGADFLKFLKSLDIAFIIFASCGRSCG